VEAEEFTVEADRLVDVGGSDIGDGASDAHERLSLTSALRRGGRGPVGMGVADVAKSRRVALARSARAGADNTLEVLAVGQQSAPPRLRRMPPSDTAQAAGLR